MKVYALIISKGSWDDYSAWTAGIFEDPFLANEAKRKLIAQIKSEVDRYSPEEYKRLEKEFFDQLGDEDDEPTTELKKWIEYNSEAWEKYNLDEFHVEEFILNEIKNLNEQ